MFLILKIYVNIVNIQEHENKIKTLKTFMKN